MQKWGVAMAKCDNCKELEVKNIWGKVPFEWCEKKNDNPDKNIERDCPYFKPKTNADRIRNMTDEELRDFLYDMTSESQCHICAFKKGWLCEKPYDKSCHDGVMEWLKSEVGCE